MIERSTPEVNPKDASAPLKAFSMVERRLTKARGTKKRWGQKIKLIDAHHSLQGSWTQSHP